MGLLDARINNNIFSKNYPMIVARNLGQVKIAPVRLAWQSGGYPAGTVLARNSTSGYYQAYNNGASSGLDTAAGILFDPTASEDFDAEAASGTTMARCLTSAEVYKDKLVGYDSAAKVDLGGREFTDANGVTTVIY